MHDLHDLCDGAYIYSNVRPTFLIVEFISVVPYHHNFFHTMHRVPLIIQTLPPPTSVPLLLLLLLLLLVLVLLLLLLLLVLPY